MNNPQQQLTSFIELFNQKRYVEAETIAKAVAEQAPESPLGWKALGAALSQQNKPSEALPYIVKAVNLWPTDIECLNILGVTLRKLNRLADAQKIYLRMIELKPDYMDAYFNLGLTFEQAGNIEQAKKCFERVVALQPAFAEGQSKLAAISQDNARRAAEEQFHQAYKHQAAGNIELARASYEQATKINPSFAEAHINLGCTLIDMGRFREAAASCRQAIKIKPDFAEAYYNLGCALQRLDSFKDAHAAYQKAVDLKPDYASAQCNLGCSLHALGQSEEANYHLQKAIALNPDMIAARWSYAMHQIPAIFSAGQDPAVTRSAFTAELDNLDQWFTEDRLAQGMSAVGSLQPFNLAYQALDNRSLLEQYGRLCARIGERWQKARNYQSAEMRSAGLIRVGIVSKHLYDHPVWNALIKGWIKHLDRNQLEIHIFNLDNRADTQTEFAKANAQTWTESKNSLDEWIQAILAKEIEVLIFPEIGMDPITLKLASLRLAPLQMASWGHPETTGLPTIDYYISAEGLESDKAPNYYSEKLLKLPHLGSCYESLNVVSVDPDLNKLRIKPNLPLLLCPGSTFKYAPENDHIFVELANTLGPCQIVFFVDQRREWMSTTFKDRLAQKFSQAALNFDTYCVFVPWLERPKFFGLMQKADVFLDTIGFSGFNTVMQAIECDLPIVTREGQFMRGRFGSGILRRLGLKELITPSNAKYVALAVKLVRNKKYRLKIKTQMKKARGILFDDTSSVRALEEFLKITCRTNTK